MKRIFLVALAVALVHFVTVFIPGTPGMPADDASRILEMLQTTEVALLGATIVAVFFLGGLAQQRELPSPLIDAAIHRTGVRDAMGLMLGAVAGTSGQILQSTSAPYTWMEASGNLGSLPYMSAIFFAITLVALARVTIGVLELADRSRLTRLAIAETRRVAEQVERDEERSRERIAAELETSFRPSLRPKPTESKPSLGRKIIDEMSRRRLEIVKRIDLRERSRARRKQALSVFIDSAKDQGLRSVRGHDGRGLMEAGLILTAAWNGFCSVHAGKHPTALIDTKEKLSLDPISWNVTLAVREISEQVTSDQHGDVAGELAALPYRLWWAASAADCHEALDQALDEIGRARVRISLVGNVEVAEFAELNFYDDHRGPSTAMRAAYRTIRDATAPASDVGFLHAFQLAMSLDRAAIILSARALLADMDGLSSTAFRRMAVSRSSLWWVGRKVRSEPKISQAVEGLVARRDIWLINAVSLFAGLVAVRGRSGKSVDSTVQVVADEIDELLGWADLDLLATIYASSDEITNARLWPMDLEGELPAMIDEDEHWPLTMDELPLVGAIALIGLLSDERFEQARSVVGAMASEKSLQLTRRGIEAHLEAWPEFMKVGIARTDRVTSDEAASDEEAPEEVLSDD